MPKVVINADDFGASSSVNKAICWAMQAGLVSSTTIMANMPGFEEACGLASQTPIAGNVGVHINLVEGLPITEPIRKCRRFCTENGRFSGRLLQRSIRLTAQEYAAVQSELNEQVQAVRNAGIQPTHLDSHHHYHTCWPIGGVLISVAKRNGIGAIRLNGNCRRLGSLVQRCYVNLYNWRLRRAGLAKTNHFGAVPEVRSRLHGLGGVVEVMVHPGCANNGSIIDLEEQADLFSLVQSLGVVELVRYPS